MKIVIDAGHFGPSPEAGDQLEGTILAAFRLEDELWIAFSLPDMAAPQLISEGSRYYLGIFHDYHK